MAEVLYMDAKSVNYTEEKINSSSSEAHRGQKSESEPEEEEKGMCLCHREYEVMNRCLLCTGV